MLKACGRGVERAVRGPSDLVARYGGDEFASLLTETDVSGAMQVAEEMRSESSMNRYPGKVRQRRST